MKRAFLLFLTIGLIVSVLFFSHNVLAQETVNLENPLKVNMDSPASLIGYIIKALLGIIGGVALVMMVYGGFQWLTAAGNEDKIKSGTQTMLWSAIGLVIVFSSYILVETVLGFFK